MPHQSVRHRPIIVQRDVDLLLHFFEPVWSDFLEGGFHAFLLDLVWIGPVEQVHVHDKRRVGFVPGLVRLRCRVEGEGILDGGVVECVEMEEEEGAQGDEEDAQEEEAGVSAQAEFSSHVWFSKNGKPHCNFI